MNYLPPLQVIWDYLWLNQKLEKADCIVGFGNFNTDIARRAAELYCQGYAPKVLFTGGLGAHGGAEKIGATVIPISSGNTALQIQTMIDFESTVLCCTPSYAMYLAEEVQKLGVKDQLKLKVDVMSAIIGERIEVGPSERIIVIIFDSF